MRAVLMAGGSGTRLRPLTCDIPKPMVPVINRPLIEHIIELLKSHGFLDIMVTLYYLPQVIRDYLGSGEQLGVNLDYSVEDRVPLGTAGSVKNVEGWLDGTSLIVISGDALTDIDLSKAMAYHLEKRAAVTIVLKRVANPLEYGVVITDESGRIVRFLEKPSSSEVFSDTVNTGIYILEPEVLKDIGTGEVDFSRDVFPLLLQRGAPLYGYVAEGYWCDVGTLEVYRQAHYDVLEGQVKIKFPYLEQKPTIWIGEKTDIDDSVVLQGPLVIGHNCLIERDVTIAAGTVLGDNVVVSAGSTLKRPIIWNNAYISPQVALRGCVIGKNTIIRSQATILEGTVISNQCVIGENSTLKPGIKLWPGKIVESGATVTESLIWGSAVPRGLFGKLGISGTVNVDLTPEFVVKIAAAYGATLGIGQRVQVSRDQLNASRMINRAFIAGLLSVGIDVMNLQDTPIPVARYQIPSQDVAGGIHTRVDLDDKTKVIIEFLDKSGLNISPAAEKKVETTFLREDFRRARLNEIGELSYPARAKEYYQQGFLHHVGAGRPPACPLYSQQRRRLKVIVDYAFQADTVILPTILGKMGIDTVVLNATLQKVPPSAEEIAVLQEQLVHVVRALHADLGVQVDGNGERFALVPESGEIVSGNHLTALMSEMMLYGRGDQAIAVTVTAPQVIERIAAAHSCRIIRTKATSRALMEGAQKPGVVMAGWGGRFILPYFHSGFDALFAVATLCELLGHRSDTLSQILQDLPPFHFRHETLPCPWEKKGLVMRQMMESSQGLRVELLDGIKVHHKDGDWALVLPDAVMPIIHLYLDADSPLGLEQLSEEYHGLIAQIQQGKPLGARQRVMET